MAPDAGEAARWNEAAHNEKLAAQFGPQIRKSCETGDVLQAISPAPRSLFFVCPHRLAWLAS